LLPGDGAYRAAFNRRGSPFADGAPGVYAQLSSPSKGQAGWAVLAERDGLTPPIHPIIELESEYPQSILSMHRNALIYQRKIF
jgi:hypothetical protein